MSIVTIIYEAKCKHCLYFQYSQTLRKNGEKSKKWTAFCKNKKSDRYEHSLTLKSKTCKNLEL